SGGLAGLLIGTGLEYAVAGSWTVKVEYDYIGYVGRVLHIDRATPVTNIPLDNTQSATKHIVKAGINYKLGEPVSAAVPVTAPVYKAMPAPTYIWTACYAGLHAGGGVMFDDWTFRNGGGGLAGGQLGCNYQAGRIVLGIEGEGWWSGLTDKQRLSVP